MLFLDLLLDDPRVFGLVIRGMEWAYPQIKASDIDILPWKSMMGIMLYWEGCAEHYDGRYDHFVR